MFPQQPQQQFRTSGADVKIFYKDSTWTKPPGASHVYMMLIGGGGNGNSTTGGGSGSIIIWYGAAQHVPDDLVLTVSTGNSSNTIVQYRGTNGLNALVAANAAVGNTAGGGNGISPFTASGFINASNGQAGSSTSISANSGTFLSGGGGVSSTTITANYGYSLSSATSNTNGTFMLQPMIVGLGGKAGGIGGIGCGGGRTGIGGPGMILIASW